MNRQTVEHVEVAVFQREIDVLTAAGVSAAIRTVQQVTWHEEFVYVAISDRPYAYD